MKNHVKLIVTLVFGVILLSGVLCPTVHAQSILVDYGSAYLANTLGQTSGSEVINVSYFVVENLATDVYTYDYTINNPVGDVELNNNGSPLLTNPNNPNSTIPENIYSFSLSFDATVPGAVTSVDEPIGGYFQNTGTSGLVWDFPNVAPGGSVLIAFQSDLAPGPGNAIAEGASPPAPWSSNPNGQQVAVPRAAPEPATTALLGLTLLLLPFRSTLRRRFL